MSVKIIIKEGKKNPKKSYLNESSKKGGDENKPEESSSKEKPESPKNKKKGGGGQRKKKEVENQKEKDVAQPKEEKEVVPASGGSQSQSGSKEDISRLSTLEYKGASPKPGEGGEKQGIKQNASSPQKETEEYLKKVVLILHSVEENLNVLKNAFDIFVREIINANNLIWGSSAAYQDLARFYQIQTVGKKQPNTPPQQEGAPEKGQQPPPAQP